MVEYRHCSSTAVYQVYLSNNVITDNSPCTEAVWCQSWFQSRRQRPVCISNSVYTPSRIRIILPNPNLPGVNKQTLTPRNHSLRLASEYAQGSMMRKRFMLCYVSPTPDAEQIKLWFRALQEIYLELMFFCESWGIRNTFAGHYFTRRGVIEFQLFGKTQP